MVRAENVIGARWLGSCLKPWTMIVSAMVLMTEGSTDLLRQTYASDPRVEFGYYEEGFVPVVISTQSVRAARELSEELRAQPNVADLLLVSWVDDDDHPGATVDENVPTIFAGDPAPNQRKEPR